MGMDLIGVALSAMPASTLKIQANDRTTHGGSLECEFKPSMS
jgi:hypothetical protein